ncbi:MAG: hypothetical protein NTZ83_06790, partial [Candidatus Pacearchaeota archaeon]|nr:hypothetical protein [Candidatus Pacearchaeota archaeon]
ALIEFARDNIKFLTSSDISLIDELRVKRNNIVYYGETITREFLKTREESIKKIVNKLLN